MCIMSSGNRIFTQTVLEIVHLIQDGFAFVTGGRDLNGRPIITFPDRNVKAEFTDEEFKQLLAYFTAVPPYASPEDVERGFVIIIDRRSSTWNRIRSLITRIEAFFPAPVMAIYVIGPTAFLQRVISEIRMGHIRSTSKFQTNQLVLINSVSELHTYMNQSQLIPEFNGTHVYDHDDWIQDRAAVENFAMKEDCIADDLRSRSQSLRQAKMPRGLEEAKKVVDKQTATRDELMSSLRASIESGMNLLNNIRSNRKTNEGPMTSLTPDKRIHVFCIERALSRLQDARQRFEDFWGSHDARLKWALMYSEFIQEAPEVQFLLDDLITALDGLLGDASADTVDRGLEALEARTAELSAAGPRQEAMVARGEALLREKPPMGEEGEEGAAAAEEVQGRAEEVRQLCDSLLTLAATAATKLRTQGEALTQLQSVYRQIAECQTWRNKGSQLLARHSKEITSVPGRREAIAELKAFVISKPDLRGIDNLHEDLPAETKASVEELRSGITQMQSECERLIGQLNAANNSAAASGRGGRGNRRESDDAAMRRRKCFTLEGLSKQLSPSLYYQDRRKPASVGDKPNDDDDDDEGDVDISQETTKVIADVNGDHEAKEEETPDWGKANPTALPVNNNCSLYLYADKCVSASCIPDNDSVDMINGNSPTDAKTENADRRLQTRKHVMRELIETERVYVESLQRIYNVFWTEIDNPANANLVPKELKEDRRSLFGNWEDLMKFHKNVLLKKFESCADQPGEMCRCFQECHDSFERYSDYCMNKYYADALLHRLGGDQHAFIRHCQSLLNHSLPLSAFLLKPVQRVQKYQLLLKEMLKNTPPQSEEAAQLETALNTMLRILRSLNDSMVLCDIVDYQRLNTKDLGRLLLHETFQVSAEQKETKSGRTKMKERHVILFEKMLLVCKSRLAGKNGEKVEYHTLHKLSMDEIGLTESTKSSSDRRFEVWINNRRLILTLQAPTVEVKHCWTRQLQELLLAQFERLREKAKMQRDKSSSRSVSVVSSPSPTSKVMKMPTPSPTTPSTKVIRSSASDDDLDEDSGQGVEEDLNSGPYPVTQV